MYMIVSSSNDHLTYSFLIFMPCISFSCLIDLAKTSSTVLNRCFKCGHPCLVLDLKKHFTILPHWLWCKLWAFHIWHLLNWGKFLLYVFCWNFFLMNRFWILSNPFSASIEMIMWFLIFHSVNVVLHIYMHMLNHPFIPGMKPTCSCCIILLMHHWIWFASILLKIFSSMLTRDIGLWFSFSVVFLLGFGIDWYNNKMSLKVFPLLFFGRVWEELSVTLLWMFNLSLKPSGPGLFFLGVFLITGLIS